MGARVKASYKFGPVFHGTGLNVTVMSLNGKVDIGLVSCSDLLPDLWELADGLPVALKELLDMAGRIERCTDRRQHRNPIKGAAIGQHETPKSSEASPRLGHQTAEILRGASR
jgi:hypothetical protein